ncbi:MAG: hypothetical protein M1834_001473 [Cirrosporium novae-zelandiae]|nr:MAG: hypothetical protein M1834_008621 [Cirrosporium novae-zelandiae]KAI9736007.1 MAG: hypothetical protein M1834_001473 [Cirrosporium novae-zelandiae]
MADSKTTPVGHTEDSHRKQSVEHEEVHVLKKLAGINGEEAAMQIAESNGWQLDAEIAQMEEQLKELPPLSKFAISFKNPIYFTYLLTAFASMGGFLSGIDQSLISGANLYMPKSLHLDSGESSLVDSSMPLGAVAGALLLSPMNEIFGRRKAILISCVFYTIGAALEAGATSYGMMLAGRLILGVGVGLEGGTVPVYVAESVARKYRGNLVSLYQFNIALGEVFGYVVAAIFVHVEGNWRYMLGSSLVFSTIMMIGMIFMPESPRYLMHKGRPVEAYEVWKRIRDINEPEARKEFFVMKYAAETEAQDETSRKGAHAWLDFFTVPRARRALIYANMMIFLGQFTGINAIMYYMSTLMSQIGFSDENSVFMSLVGGGALMLGTIPAILYMERFGRRFWANAMLPCFFVGLVLSGVSYLVPQSNLPAVEGLYLTGLILYTLFFGSYSCLTWVIPSEVYPTYLRSYGMTTSDALLFLCSFLVTYNFTRMQTAMTKTGLTLGFYGGIAVLGWFYQLLFMPETKNKTLEEIDLIFSKPTGQLVRENLASVGQTMSDIGHLRLRKVFAPDPQGEVVETHVEPTSEPKADDV